MTSPRWGVPALDSIGVSVAGWTPSGGWYVVVRETPSGKPLRARSTVSLERAAENAAARLNPASPLRCDECVGRWGAR